MMNNLVNEHGQNNIEIVARCLFTNKCINYDYEYYFELNNEKVKADYCITNRYGYSRCDYNGIKYTNVPFETIYKGYHYENTNFYFVTYMCIFLFILKIIINFIFKILNGDVKE